MNGKSLNAQAPLGKPYRFEDNQQNKDKLKCQDNDQGLP